MGWCHPLREGGSMPNQAMSNRYVNYVDPVANAQISPEEHTRRPARPEPRRRAGAGRPPRIRHGQTHFGRSPTRCSDCIGSPKRCRTSSQCVRAASRPAAATSSGPNTRCWEFRCHSPSVRCLVRPTARCEPCGDRLTAVRGGRYACVPIARPAGIRCVSVPTRAGPARHDADPARSVGPAGWDGSWRPSWSGCSGEHG